MSTVPVRTYTPAEYLALERASETKHEYFRGEIFAMAGAKFAHNRISANLIGVFHDLFKDRPCTALSSDMRVKCATGLYTYPDVSVVCGTPELEDDGQDTLINPQVIIEVLSPSTEAYDRGKKFEHYRTLSSLREYVLVAQDHASVERFVRPQDAGPWAWTVQSDLHDVLELATVDCRIALADIYQGVAFPPPTIADVSPFTLYPDGPPSR